MIGKYTPKLPSSDINVNAPDTSPLKDFFLLLGGIGLAAAGLYIVLGFLVQLLLERYEPQANDYLAKLFAPEESTTAASEPARLELQKLLDALIEKLPEDERTYTLHLVDEESINAVAFPGGHIVVYQGLLDNVESENELSMVLAHELGHYAGQDHLQGLGRALVFFFFSVALTGQESYISSLLGEALQGTQGSFSRSQELEADAFALSLLQKRYGHVGGAKDFFLRLAKTEDGFLIKLLSSTHPLSMKRVDELESLRLENGFTLGEVIPLSQALQN